MAAGVASIVARVAAGQVLDRGSRGHWILAGYGALLVSFTVFIVADSIVLFVVAGIVSAIGSSLSQPALMAFAIDRAAPGRMGKAMATYSMFYRVGEGVGSPLAGALIVGFGYAGMYVGAMALAVAGILLTAINWGTVGKPVGAHMAA
jgi:MFS family permease